MKNFSTRVYSIGDFLEWQRNDLLNLSPDFQRRGVWSTQAKSYLMDTIITGKPMPKILITQSLRDARSKKIIDGQQRLRAIIEYCSDNYTIYKSHNEEYGGILYSNLPQEIKSEILNYQIGVDLLYDLSYEETLDIFARLNTYSVRLNPQEVRNAEFPGPFKQSSYKIGYKYVTYWEESGMLTKQKVARMAEAELASDLLVVAVGGIEPKRAITNYYKQHNKEDSDLTLYANKVIEALDLITEIYSPDELKETHYTQIQLFYSLFCAVYHSLFGIKDFDGKRNLNIKEDIGRTKVKLNDFSQVYDTEDPSIGEFIDALRRAATEKAQRKVRAKILCDVIAG